MIRLCCFIKDHKRCENPAEWEIWEIDKDGICGPDDFIDACPEHVGFLLTDKPEHRIFPIKEADLMDLSGISSYTLIKELTKRKGVREYKISRNEEGVFTRLVCGLPPGFPKTPGETIWGIFDATVLVIEKEDHNGSA